MKELRTFICDEIEFRDIENQMMIEGYAIQFDKLSENLGGFKEVIDKRALDGVDLSDTYLLSQHNTADVLGSTASKTLNLTVTESGLHFSAELPNTQLGRDTYTLLKRKDLKSMSFGFTVDTDKWNVKTEPQTRTVTQIGILSEISIVTNPAYTQSNVSARAQNMSENLLNCKKCINDINNIKQNQYLESGKEILNQIKG